MTENIRLKIGVLGCAAIADRFMIPAIQESDDYELAAVASRSVERARVFGEKYSCRGISPYDRLLEYDDIDAVYIPLPNALHYEWAMKALESGKHCLVEKPIAPDRQTADKMVRTARSNKLVLFENFMFLYHSQHRFVLERIRGGDIGEIRCFRSSFGFPPLPEDNIRYSRLLGGGSLMDAGVYPLVAAQMILGNDLRVTSAVLAEDDQRGVDISGGAFLVGSGNIFAQIAFGFDNYYQCNYEVWGSRGKITTHRAFTAGPGISPRVLIEKPDESRTHDLPPDNHFLNILDAFCRTIRNGDAEPEFKRILTQAGLLEEVTAFAGK